MWFGQRIYKRPAGNIHGRWRPYATREDALADGCQLVSVLPLACTVNEYHDWMIRMAAMGKHPKTCRPNFGFYGPFYADFDTENLSELLPTLHQRLCGLMTWGLKETDFQLWFTGKKGIHLHLSPALFGASTVVHRKLPDIYKQMARNMNLADIIDPNVYSKGRGRLWRVEGDLRNNGCRKIPIHFSQLLLPPSELFKMAFQPFWVRPTIRINVQPLPRLVDCFQRALHGLEKDKPAPQNQMSRFESKVFPATPPNRIKKALNTIPREYTNQYGPWLKVGMALHQGSGGRSWGLQLWHGWSQQSPKYQAEALDHRWRNFRVMDNGITLGTLFHLSRPNPPKPRVPSHL